MLLISRSIDRVRRETLGLVWGAGFRVFGNWRTVPDAAEAALPFRYLACGPAYGYRPVTLAPSTWGPPPLKRPLAITELRDLATKFSTLPEQVRHRLQRAMARLRDRIERFDDEDRAIDLSIALSVLFIEEHETDYRAVRVPQRAAWLYADSACERRQTEDMLSDFLRHHSNIERGQASAEPDAEVHERTAALLAGADDVLRATLKTTIAVGLPEDWSSAADRTVTRHNPPRTAAEIPSVKSDSLSWSVEEKRGIDQALEALWRPIVEQAPLPPPGRGPSRNVGLAPELVEPHHEQGVPYVVVHPARLFMAHPKWPTAACEPLDERAEYYCPLDVARHSAASGNHVRERTLSPRPGGGKASRPGYLAAAVAIRGVTHRHRCILTSQSRTDSHDAGPSRDASLHRRATTGARLLRLGPQ